MAKPTVLVVAPEGLARRLTVQGLEVFDYPVLTAADSDEAATLLRSGRRIGAIVLDVDQVTGDLDALALAQLAREIDSRIGVIYTARMPQMMPESRKVRGAPTLRIPFVPYQLTSVLADLRSDRAGEAPMSRAA